MSTQAVRSQSVRRPEEISGAIRKRVEWLLSRNIGLDELSCANWQDSNRINILLDELDSSLFVSAAEASLCDQDNDSEDEVSVGSCEKCDTQAQTVTVSFCDPSVGYHDTRELCAGCLAIMPANRCGSCV